MKVKSLAAKPGGGCRLIPGGNLFVPNDGKSLPFNKFVSFICKLSIFNSLLFLITPFNCFVSFLFKSLLTSLLDLDVSSVLFLDFFFLFLDLMSLDVDCSLSQAPEMGTVTLDFLFFVSLFPNVGKSTGESLGGSTGQAAILLGFGFCSLGCVGFTHWTSGTGTELRAGKSRDECGRIFTELEF